MSVPHTVVAAEELHTEVLLAVEPMQLGLGLELLLLEQALEPLELVQALVLVLELPEPQPLHRLPSGRTPFP